MLIRTVIGRFSLVVLAAAMAAPATARQDKREQSRSSRWSALLDVDLMVNTYSRFLARKYDLNEEQDEYTRQYLAEQANLFMDAHRDEVSDLIDRMFEVRTGGEMESDELIDWGKRILPIYQEAKKIIVMGNGEWRDILTDEQKAIHDSDLKMMHQSFETTEDQLHRIVTGEMSVEEFRKPRNTRRTTRRPPQTAKAQPAEPRNQLQEWKERDVADRGRSNEENFDAEEAEAMARLREADRELAAAERAARRAERMDEEMAPEPVERLVTRPPKRTPPTRTTRKTPAAKTTKSGGANFESTWETYTRKFIEKYKLNDGQTQKANSILRDCQEQGRRHMAKSKSRFGTIEKKLADLKSSEKKKRAEKMLALNEQQKKLREPVDRIFENQLKPRLEKLPTRAQRKAAESGSKSSRRSGKKDGR